MELLAWCCCIYTMRLVRAHPYLWEVVEGHELTPGLHSSADDFHAPFLQYDELNQEGFINHKRPQGSPPAAHYQPGFSNSNPEWLSWNVNHDYPKDANPENGVISEATKRQKTVQNDQFATPAPQSNYGFDTACATGTTNKDMFWPVGIKEPVFQSIPNHEFERPQEDPNASQLHKESLPSEFQHFNDLMWLSPLENVEQASPSPLEQQLLPDSASPGLVTGGNSAEHTIVKLSEQLDKEFQPVHLILPWDPELAKLRISGTSIDEEILKGFMHKFELCTGKLLSFKNLKFLDVGFSHLGQKLPVLLYEFSINPLLYQIRVEIAPEFFNHNINPKLPRKNTKEKIMKQVAKLILWLLYINAAVLRNLSVTGTMSTNHKLVDWIFNEIFEPQNSLPVIGRFGSQDIQAFKKGKEFGPIQRMLITLLSSSLRSSREPQTAVMIISNYYETKCPEIMCALKSGKLPDLRSLAIQSKVSNVRIGSGLDEGSWFQELGNFPVRSLQQLPESLKPNSYSIDPFSCIRMNLQPIKQELSGHIMKILSARNTPIFHSGSFIFKDSQLPVVIKLIKEPFNQGRKHGWVCLLHTSNQTPIQKITVLNRLKKFMSHLDICHSALLIHMKNIKFDIGFELQPLLTNWFDQVLFDINQNKLPLLGDFVLEEGISIDSFSPESFNIIQRLVICLITSKNSHRRNFQGALSVFGYWLKNMAGTFYSHLFENDEEYWDILTKIIDPFSYGENEIF
ncbi:hypothetical protein VP01_2291g2 [Puccinia sorghi]|uniref:Uncharacterized protein n=1 Tax=Puccinia sorghi TaxID=27349 RepID=A0A0L6V7Y1_9BASI|nr:hypothetical protein VP01_2291g2 [Puccinia sorghi]